MSRHPTDAAARLRLLYEVTSLRAGKAETRLEAALEVVTQALSLDVGVITRSKGETNTIVYVYSADGALRRGQSFPLEQTYSSLTLKSGGVLSINELASSPYAQHPFYQRFGYESYIGAAVTVNGALYGTLGFSGTAPRSRPFTSADEELVTMLARWVGVALKAQTAEALRRESEERFRRAFHDAAIGMAMVAPDGRALEVNAGICKMLGYSAAELLALSVQQLTHPGDLEADLDSVRRLLAGELETYELEKRYLHKDGRIVWGHLSVSAVRRDDGEIGYLIAQIQDITPRKHYEAQIRTMAYRDDLTGLPHRRYFFARAPEQLASARRHRWPVALIYLDLNGFKEVNDTLGHQAGDALLKRVAQVCSEVLREDDLFTRFGGDEFVTLLCNASEVEARRTAGRLIACVQSTFATQSGSTGVSLGIVVAPGGAIDIETLLNQADGAMYRAKGRKDSEPYAVEVVRFDGKTALD